MRMPYGSHFEETGLYSKALGSQNSLSSSVPSVASNSQWTDTCEKEREEGREKFLLKRIQAHISQVIFEHLMQMKEMLKAPKHL